MGEIFFLLFMLVCFLFAGLCLWFVVKAIIHRDISIFSKDGGGDGAD